jgi:uncharacterized protein YkwD
MKLQRGSLGVLAVVAAFVVVLLFVLPIVPYSLTFHPVAVDVIRFACGPDNTLTCTSTYSSSPPPFTVTGRAALSFSLLGVGTPPFSSTYAFPEGTGSNLFFVRGTNITGAELVPFTSYELNPVGVVAIQNTTVARGPLGIVNFTATVENVGSAPLDDVSVGFGVPGNGNNATIDGVTWISYADYTFTGKICPSTLAPRTDCVASFQAEVETLTPGQTFGYHVQVSGQLGTEGIVYNRWFQGVWPTKEATPSWVSYFLQDVNANRTGPKLVENSTLDAFAKVRFQTQVANSNISNYGFQQDFGRFFSGSALQVGETTLWPGTDSPLEYVSILQQSAPGHWTVLTNPSYTRFGYYIGYGPTIIVSQPCPVTEFPGGQNIPALLASQGCQFHIEQTVWLVIEVGS